MPFVTGGTVIGRGAAVSDGAKVSGAVVFDDAKIGDDAVVTDSVIGRGAVIGPRTVLRGVVVGITQSSAVTTNSSTGSGSSPLRCSPMTPCASPTRVRGV